MVLPVNVDTATVAGSFIKLDGTPCTGTVTFTPVPARLLDAGADPPTTIIGTPIVATLDEFGAVALELPATDDADLNPVDWGYHVSVRLGADTAYSFCMTAAAGTTVDLAVVTPIYTADGDPIVAGPPGVAGPAGEGVPEGGDTADVLAKASGDDFDTVWVPASAPGAHAATHTAGSSDPVAITTAQVTGLAAHLATIDAHAVDTTGIHGIADTAALETTSGAQARVDAHVNDTTAAHAATAISYAGSTTLAATTVETALDELDTEKAALSLFPGGTTGQVLAKNSNTNYDLEWVDLAAGASVFDDDSSGIVPASGGGTVNYLRADATWATPASAGAISSHVTFSYNATTSEPPTGNQLRMNSTTQTAVTRLWISQTTVDGLDVSVGLAKIVAGHHIYIQDRDDAAKWVKYLVSAPGTDDGSYYDFTVTYYSGTADVPTGQVELQSLAPTADGFGIEGAVDAVAAALVEGTGIDVTYDDGAGTITVATTTVAQTINAQTGTTYTLVLGDAAKLVTLTNASAITLTVPTNASVAYAVGTHVDLAQLGAGQVTVAGAGGVTVNATPTLKLRAQYAAASLVKLATDTWLLVGDLAAT